MSGKPRLVRQIFIMGKAERITHNPAISGSVYFPVTPILNRVPNDISPSIAPCDLTIKLVRVSEVKSISGRRPCSCGKNRPAGLANNDEFGILNSDIKSKVKVNRE